MPVSRSWRHALAAPAVLPASLTAQTKLLRFPDIHGDKVVFTYARDLWSASIAGGAANRLTAHPGLELRGTSASAPITSESDLVYLDMVLANRKRVDELSGGRVGYIHIPNMGIPNMGAQGIREFIKWLYPQIRKEGLVVDVRANGGGNVSELLTERLRRELLATRFSRTDHYTNTYPGTVFVGPMVALLDQNSASDGDIVPAMFRQARIGPLIGKRSWGGVVGITDHGPLIDGGTISVPEFGFANIDGQWIIEGHDVDPDIVVEQDAALVLAGHDLQLERGVQEVLKLMQTRRHVLPAQPPDPVKTIARRLHRAIMPHSRRVRRARNPDPR